MSLAMVEGPAFSSTFKALATVIVVGCACWLARLWMQGALGSGGSSGLVWFGCGLVMMSWTWWHIMRSRTRVSAEALEQGWIWDKRMELRELAYAKLIRVPGLDWLVAPRLYVRTLPGKFAVFYGGSPALVSEFRRVVDSVKPFTREP